MRRRPPGSRRGRGAGTSYGVGVGSLWEASPPYS